MRWRATRCAPCSSACGRRWLCDFLNLTITRTLIYAQACYEVRAVAERLWAPLAARAKDYIAAPKPNGYRSLHATLRVPGVTVELGTCGAARAGTRGEPAGTSAAPEYSYADSAAGTDSVSGSAHAGSCGEPAGSSAASAYSFAGSAVDKVSVPGSGGRDMHSSADWAYRSRDGAAQVASASGSMCEDAAAHGGDAARLRSSSTASSSAGHGHALPATRERGGSQASSSSDSEPFVAQQHRHMSGIIGEGTHGGVRSSRLSREESAEAQEGAQPCAGTHDAEGIALELQIRTRGAPMLEMQSRHPLFAVILRVVTGFVAPYLHCCCSAAAGCHLMRLPSV